jgi:hypothetical protein
VLDVEIVYRGVHLHSSMDLVVLADGQPNMHVLIPNGSP